jgi:hypothetical protein
MRAKRESEKLRAKCSEVNIRKRWMDGGRRKILPD